MPADHLRWPHFYGQLGPHESLLSARKSCYNQNSSQFGSVLSLRPTWDEREIRKLVKFAIITTLIFCFSTCLLGEDLISINNQTILSKSDGLESPTVSWVPTTEQTSQGLRDILNFLESEPLSSKPFGFQIKEILKQLKGYKVKFSGVAILERKLLHCYFYKASQAYGSIEGSVDGGGISFWKIDVDIETHECINFQPNGES